MTDAEIVDGIQAPGRFDAAASSEAEALRLVRSAFPGAIALSSAVTGQPYPSPPPGVKCWFQVHPAELQAGNPLPHVKYADWTRGKKGQGGSWGHVAFPPIP